MLIFRHLAGRPRFVVTASTASVSVTGTRLGTVIEIAAEAVVGSGIVMKVAVVEAAATAKVLYIQGTYSHNPDMFCTLYISHNQLTRTSHLSLCSKTHLVARRSTLSSACDMFHTCKEKKGSNVSLVLPRIDPSSRWEDSRSYYPAPLRLWLSICGHEANLSRLNVAGFLFGRIQAHHDRDVVMSGHGTSGLW